MDVQATDEFLPFDWRDSWPAVVHDSCFCSASVQAVVLSFRGGAGVNYVDVVVVPLSMGKQEYYWKGTFILLKQQ